MLRGIVQVDILALMSTLEFTDGMETLLKKAVEDLSATIIIVSHMPPGMVTCFPNLVCGDSSLFSPEEEHGGDVAPSKFRFLSGG